MDVHPNAMRISSRFFTRPRVGGQGTPSGLSFNVSGPLMVRVNLPRGPVTASVSSFETPTGAAARGA